MTAAEGFLAPGEPVDLDNCAREPIHIPGSIQPRGALVAVGATDGIVAGISANAAELLQLPVADAATYLDRPLADLLGETAAARIARQMTLSGDLRDHNPLDLVLALPGGDRHVDVVLHRPPAPVDLVIVELEDADGGGPVSFSSSYREVRRAIVALESATSLAELYDITAAEVRTLTGFDRVMVYRFDENYNGEVVAEAMAEGLESFLGLHYPAEDIPPQARALYEKNWLRLISDIHYTPAALLGSDRLRGEPIDLTFSTLRSVSPIHIEYLTLMGVDASMSISLLDGGKLWGLIACHHYSGPHAPSYGIRAAAEFLGAALSIRLVAQEEEERTRASRAVASSLADLVARSRVEAVPLAVSLTDSESLLEVVGADGAIVVTEDHTATMGETPDEAGWEAILAWARSQDADVVHSQALLRTAPEVAEQAPGVAGVLVVNLPAGQAVIWLRQEVERKVDWGGDPRGPRAGADEGRLSPRRSFERWREIVRGQSEPWPPEQLEVADVLRRHLVEALYLRSRRDARAAEMLQRSSLPTELPEHPGWQVLARYSAADGGAVGGDWYDALHLPSGGLALAVGDVTGHGMRAASTMGQLRNTLRAHLVSTGDIRRAVTEIDEFIRWALPGEIATALVASVDVETGVVTYVAAGHLTPLLIAPDGSTSFAPIELTRPLGLGPATPAVNVLRVPPGGGLLLYTDGLLERRTASLAEGMALLQRAVEAVGTDLDRITEAVREPDAEDDATLLVLLRDRL